MLKLHDCPKLLAGSRGALGSQSPQAALARPRSPLHRELSILLKHSEQLLQKREFSQLRGKHAFLTPSRAWMRGTPSPRVSECGSPQLHPLTSGGKSVSGQVGDAGQTCLVEPQAHFNTISRIPTIMPSFPAILRAPLQTPAAAALAPFPSQATSRSTRSESLSGV